MTVMVDERYARAKQRLADQDEVAAAKQLKTAYGAKRARHVLEMLVGPTSAGARVLGGSPSRLKAAARKR